MTTNWNTVLGLTSATGPNGEGISIAYDSNARPSSFTSTDGAVTNYTYNDNASPPTKVATTNGHWVRTTMDGLGRTIKTETGNSTTVVSVVDTVYAPCGCSPLGKVSQVSQPHAPGGTQYWTTYTYDASGRTLTTTLPEGSVTTYAYQGNTVTVTDPAGKWKKFTMDAFGNLTSVQEPDPSLGTVTATYTYDILNNLIQATIPRGNNTQTRTFNYINATNNPGAFLFSATTPENGTVTYTYNTNATLASKTDAKGQQFSYTYASLNRLTQIKVGTSVLRTFMYDTNTLDGSFSQNSQGRLVAVQNAQSTFTANGSSPSAVQFTEMYSYTSSGQVVSTR